MAKVVASVVNCSVSPDSGQIILGFNVSILGTGVRYMEILFDSSQAITGLGTMIKTSLLNDLSRLFGITGLVVTDIVLFGAPI